MDSPKHIMIVAGETSGDLHAARLVQEIQQLEPSITFSGLGGQHLASCGVKLDADLTELAVIGFVEVLKHYKEFRKLFYEFLEHVRVRKPSVVLLVDYPGFNLRLAKELKKMGVKVVYYISPQIWAWKAGRIKLIEKFTDHMMVLFKFEKKFYEDRGVHVEFVGHPLVDEVHASHSKEHFLSHVGFDPSKPVFGLVPGSRSREIETLLPPMLAAAEIITKEIPNAQFILTQAPNISIEMIHAFTQRSPISLRIVHGDFHNAVNACDMCIVTSGTATLETALLEKPMVIIYKTAFLTYLLGRLLVKIKHFGLANIVAGEEVVPECLQNETQPAVIAEKLLTIYRNPKKFQDIKSKLQKIKQSLGQPGASRRAAEIVLAAVA